MIVTDNQNEAWYAETICRKSGSAGKKGSSIHFQPHQIVQTVAELGCPIRPNVILFHLCSMSAEWPDLQGLLMNEMKASQ